MGQRGIARQPLAAVVVGEDDQRGLGQSEAVERGQDLPHTPVGPLENSHIILPGSGQ